MTVLQILKRMRKLFREDGSRWCQGAMAQDKHGSPVDESSPNAKCFCLVGALYKVTSDYWAGARDARDALNAALPRNSRWGLILYNDNKRRKFADIAKLLDKAIKAEEARSL